jgi:SHS2 domain-containing protein
VPFAFFDHTGDVGVDVRASTLGGLFADAAAALAETVTDSASARADTSISIALSAPDLELLLVDFLNELLFRFEIDGFVAAAAQVHLAPEGSAGWHLEAEVAGEIGASSRLPIKVLIKAVTYHALEVRQEADAWTARVVFDI